MTYELLTALRYKSEGTDIDFKQAQYRFIGGSDDEKSEMLKDILAIANAWREGPGYILLGFKDRRPHPAQVVGITESIDDAKLQQFVSSKVKPKLTFRYEEHLYDGMTVGVVTITKQKRPFFLVNPFGKLKKNVVYVRRGSSTDEAEPSEITDMGLADAGRGRVRLDLSVLTPSNEELPAAFVLRYMQFAERLPDYESPRQTPGPFEMAMHSSIWHDNKNFWREYAEYVRLNSALINIKFVLRNRSEVQLSNAKLEVSVDALEGQSFRMFAGADLPEQPNSQWSIHGIRSMPEMLERREARLVVDEGGVAPNCHVRFGSLLPGEEGRSSDTLAIVPLGPGKLRLRFRILAGELPEPQEAERMLEATGEVTPIDVDGLEELYGRALLAQCESSTE